MQFSLTYFESENFSYSSFRYIFKSENVRFPFFYERKPNLGSEMWKIKLQKIVRNLLDKLRTLHRSHESPLCTAESTINLTYQTVMRSCYKPGKILNENKLRLPDGRWIRKRSFPCQEEKETSLSLHYILVAVIRPQSLPSAVLRSTGLWWLGRFYSTKTKAIRGINREIQLQSIITGHKYLLCALCTVNRLFAWLDQVINFR